jgi:hypothetical protein
MNSLTRTKYISNIVYMTTNSKVVRTTIEVPLGTRLIIDYSVEASSRKLTAIDGTSIKPMIERKRSFSTTNSAYGSFYNK